MFVSRTPKAVGLITITAVDFALTAILIAGSFAATKAEVFAAPPLGKAYGQAQSLNAPGEDFSVDRLSEQASRVIRHVLHSGETRTFLVLDKNRANIIIVENGRITLTGSALTGKSRRDVFPKHAYRKAMDNAPDDERITPAGRFGVYRVKGQYGLGESLRVVGMDGADTASGRRWFIGLHKTYTGNKAEQRQKRLASGNPDERRITNGCINVDQGTMNEIMKFVPLSQGKTLPLYVLPHDEALTDSLFRISATATIPGCTRPAHTETLPRQQQPWPEPNRNQPSPPHWQGKKVNPVFKPLMDFINQFVP